ncbi:hypothetical protein [Parasulfitobacter algicola]|uniref:Uncharacterized protein n=1 Tax=Parasulfitobacter algicola TaxID=2614809 RepID=A0ABX2IVJ3_9RHOB|nr:hypothetical protein [Sulfitobacter algicola]NSX56928.1 hypothetical protein [Sulfitobacter algicola]
MIEFGLTVHLQTFPNGEVEIYLMRVNNNFEFHVIGVHFSTEKELSSARKDVILNLLDNLVDNIFSNLDFKFEAKNPRTYYSTKFEAIDVFKKELLG